jgi:hypothetical protein
LASARSCFKRARGGTGKPVPPRWEGTPQRGERQEGMVLLGSGSAVTAVERVEPFEVVTAVRAQPETAREAWFRKRNLISLRRKALKAKAQERCRGETDPAGRKGGP